MLWTAVNQIDNRSSILPSCIQTLLLQGFVLAAFMDLMSSRCLFAVVFKLINATSSEYLSVSGNGRKTPKGNSLWKCPLASTASGVKLFFCGYITIRCLTVPPSSPISVIISAPENKAPLSAEGGWAYGRERAAQGAGPSAADTD